MASPVLLMNVNKIIPSVQGWLQIWIDRVVPHSNKLPRVVAWPKPGCLLSWCWGPGKAGWLLTEGVMLWRAASVAGTGGGCSHQHQALPFVSGAAVSPAFHSSSPSKSLLAGGSSPVAAGRHAVCQTCRALSAGCAEGVCLPLGAHASVS